MIGIWVMSAAVLLACFKPLKNLKIKYALIILAFILLNLPLYQGFSALKLFYSLFDGPCALSVLLLLAFILRMILKDFNAGSPLYQFLEKKRLNLGVWVVFFVFGLILYLGFLNFISLDIYHFNAYDQGLICLAFVLILYFIRPFIGLLALVAFLFSWDQNAFDALMDVYLWIFSFIILVINLIKAAFFKVFKR